MRHSLPLLLAGIALAAAPAQALKRASPEAQLAKALEGRVAGEPVDCLDLSDIRSTRIIDRTAILYETGGGKLYVNRPDGGAGSLDRFDVMVNKVWGGRLCDVDVVDLYDPGARIQTGFVFLGKFVPYTKPNN